MTEDGGQSFLVLMNAAGKEGHHQRYGHPLLGPEERLGEADERPDEEEADVDDGDDGGQQFHEDDLGVRAVETFNIDVLLLGLLVLQRVQLRLERGQVFPDVDQPLLALVEHLLLHVLDAGVDVDDLVLVQLRQVVHLLLQPLKSFALLSELVEQSFDLVLEQLPRFLDFFSKSVNLLLVQVQLLHDRLPLRRVGATERVCQHG